MAENIQLAVRGWQHPHWCGSFYPDDLPDDWQLTYYSNEFDAVLVPAEFWHSARLRQSIDWCAQVPAEFSFYVEWPMSLDASARAELYHQLVAMQPNLAGLLLPAPLPNAECESLRQHLPGVPQYQPAQLWIPEVATSRDEASLAQLAQPWSDLRQLRQWLERFTAEQSTVKRALLCTMAEPDVVQLQQARTLMQIMGL